MALLQASPSSFLSHFPAVSPAKPVKLSVLLTYRKRHVGGFSVKAEAEAEAEAGTGVLLVEKSDAHKVGRLKKTYLEKIVPLLTEEFKYTNVHQVPKIEKIVVNCGIGDAAQNNKGLEAAISNLSLITGQRPYKTKSKAAIATFKIRENQTLGIAVTLRRKLMYAFLDRLINLGLPRSSDFQGLNPNSFDGYGNYSLGIDDQSVFPELGYDIVGRPEGMDVCIKTSAQTDKEAYKLLYLMGMPFKDDEGPTEVVKKKKLRRHHFDSKTKQRARR